MKKKADILLLMLVSIVTTGCNQLDDTAVAKEGSVSTDGTVDLRLDFTLSSAATKDHVTRQSDAVFSSPTIGALRIIPMRDNRIDNLFLSGENYVEKTNARFYHYTKCKMS